MAETLSYVYAILRAGVDISGRVAGIAGSEVRLVTSGSLAALVSTVDAGEFGEQGLRKNLEDMGWLETTVRAHSRVVEAAITAAPVAPLALATVYYNDDRVRAALAERGPAFADILELISGHAEWGVKAFADVSRKEQREPTASGPGGSQERPGQAYLGKLRERRKGQAEAERDVLQQAEEIHAALSDLSHANRVHPPQNRDLAGYQGLMVLNGAYLVDGARTEEFIAAVESIAAESALRIELTGPWAPYSFAMVEGTDQR
ncbi:GvpL/GvpF family gas vesicle protein [Saccharopolyspora pogona]|uniref:GvpL/GvpF family gas vesicle protein n=1 Tax=Saccharopolyspora pogona TaxID=333966 RepID=UPI00168A0E0D|nr:GvpL/GvpF family gas vesicle protein [Saccharopolyspora pogona]